MRIELENKKYTVVLDDDGDFYALRYGERWRELGGDKLILSMAQRIDELQEELGISTDDEVEDIAEEPIQDENEDEE
jgi:hypothetical protein